MGTKINPGQHDCYHNAMPDEPMFVLLARDPDAPDVVRFWAGLRERRIRHGQCPRGDESLVREAAQCAIDMEEWREDNDVRWRNGNLLAPLTQGK